MKFMTFRHQDRVSYGWVEDQQVWPVSQAFQARLPTLRQALAADGLLEATAAHEPPLALEEVEFLPPVPDAGRILGIGMNYTDHIREMGREPPEYPAMFVRFADSLVGHRQPLLRPRASAEYDYEGELAVIIGRPGRRIPEARALEHVAGYCCFMDGSVRDFQRHTTQFTAGKNFPASGAAGPWLVTADELPDPGALTLETRVSGELLQSGRTAELCIKVPEVIAYLSTIFELQPGDMIATGTPSGVGFARRPPRWLRPGDTVEVQISGIGTLANTVTDEAA